MFDNTPDRQVVLATLSNWASQANLPTPIYAGQAKIYVAEGPESEITITPGLGALPPRNLYKTIDLAANPPPPIFKRDIDDIRTGRRAAFMVVCMDHQADYAPVAYVSLPLSSNGMH